MDIINLYMILGSVIAVIIFIIVIIIVFKLMHSNINKVKTKPRSTMSDLADNPYIKRDFIEKKEEKIPQKSMICTYCGAELKKSSTYCPLCGAKLL